MVFVKVKYTWIFLAPRVYAQTPLTRSDMDHTQCYLQTTPYLPLLPVAEHHRSLAGTRTYPRRDGQAELTWVVG